MSTIAGQSLFDSGPHRFVIRNVGRLWVPPLRLDPLQDTVLVYAANLEVAIVQTGRLVAANTGALWTQVELIRNRAESLLTGTLVDNNGQSWTGMTLLTFRPEDRVDRGRVVSLGYRADYVRLA